MEIITKCPHCNGDIEITISKKERGQQLGQQDPNQVKPENVKCPECGSNMVSRKGQYGTFWGCTQYPNCKGTRDSMGRSRAEREAEKEQEREPKHFGFSR